MSRVTGSPAGSVSVPVVKYFPHFENWPFAGEPGGLSRLGGGWSAVMPDGSYQADIMEDVAIWTETNFSCSKQPTYTWNQLQKYIRKNIGLWNISDQINIVQDLDRDQVLCCNQPSPHLLWIFKNISKQEISDVRVGLENKDYMSCF